MKNLGSRSPQFNKEYFQALGKHIKLFIDREFGSQRAAAKKLGYSEYVISRIITGRRKPDQRFILALTRYGFDKEHFERWLHLSDIKPEQLSKNELIELIIAYKNVVIAQKEMIESLADLNTRLQDNYAFLLKLSEKIIKNEAKKLGI